MTKKKLYFRIGLPKTGNTAVRKFIYANREKLRELGFHYPAPKEISIEATNFHNGAAFGLTAPFGNPEVRAATEKDFLDDAANFLFGDGPNHHFTHFFITSGPQRGQMYDKPIWRDDAEELWEKFFDGLSDYDVRIMMYLRRQDCFAESYLAHLVKMGHHTGELHQGARYWLETGALEYRRQLDMLAKFIGKENIIVKVYERDQLLHQDAIADFFDIFGIGMEDADFVFPEGKLNPPVHKEYAKAITCLRGVADTLPAGYLDPAAMFREHAELLSWDENTDCKFTTKNILPPALRYEIATKYQEDNTYIAEEYLGREAGDPLFYDPLPDPNTPYEPYVSELSTEKMVELFGRVAVTQHQTIYSLQAALEQTQCRLAQMEQQHTAQESMVGNRREPRNALVHTVTSPLRTIRRAISPTRNVKRVKRLKNRLFVRRIEGQ